MRSGDSKARYGLGMPKSMKVLAILATIILVYLFIDLSVKIKTQHDTAYITQLEIKLQDAESRVATQTLKLDKTREENRILKQENTMMSATMEGIMYQEAAQDE